MRLSTGILALAVTAAVLPRIGRADDERPPAPVRSEEGARPYMPSPEPRQAPDEPRRDALGPYPRSPSAPQYVPRPPPPPPSGYYPPRPRVWWGGGWGWGWGWDPIYPYAPGPHFDARDQPVRDEADRIYTRLSLYGAGQTDGYVAGVSLNIEGRSTGFDLDVSALEKEAVTGPLRDRGTEPISWNTAHLTWAILSERSVQLRVETGASMLSLPASDFTAQQPWRGKTIIGPDVGLSGQIGLLGPFGIEGHAWLTPFPVRTADSFLGLALHDGPIGMHAGWRSIDVAGRMNDAPKVSFSGPEVALVLGF